MELTKTNAALSLSKGYKQTEVGFIPEDWNIKTTIACAKNGEAGIKIGPFGSALKKDLLVRQGYKVYGQENIFDRDIEIGDRFITLQHFRKLKSCELLPGDFVVSMMGTIGQCMILPENMEEGIMDSHLLRIKLDDSVVFPAFFEHVFSSSIALNQVKKLSVGGIMDGLSSKIVKRIQYPLPPTLTEQKAIATALSDADELISSLEKLITKKKAIKQGAMQELLTPPHKGGKRLSGFSGEWEEQTLGSLLIDFQNGYAFSASGYQKEGIPIVTMAQIGLSGQFQFDENKVNHWSIEELNNLKPFTLHQGDLIISMTDVTPEKNLIGRMAIVNEPGPLFLNQRVGHLRINRDLVNPTILKHLSNMRSWRTYSKAIASLGVQANIGTTDIKNGVFWLPKIDEQNAIAQILSDMDEEIEVLENKKMKYQAIKQGMMQELLTGKTRLV